MQTMIRTTPGVKLPEAKIKQKTDSLKRTQGGALNSELSRNRCKLRPSKLPLKNTTKKPSSCQKWQVKKQLESW
ncbi:hypothetical protein [uncultured Alistipes sp.]|uniref:hypothetical protein n=1 Tax=uncultured Alistipes sp. TaxID=538949 RepID=UPI00272BEA8C|nr:hypothetical protein [uncultured Alistipes sp.]